MYNIVVSTCHTAYVLYKRIYTVHVHVHVHVTCTTLCSRGVKVNIHCAGHSVHTVANTVGITRQCYNITNIFVDIFRISLILISITQMIRNSRKWHRDCQYCWSVLCIFMIFFYFSRSLVDLSFQC